MKNKIAKITAASVCLAFCCSLAGCDGLYQAFDLKHNSSRSSGDRALVPTDPSETTAATETTVEPTATDSSVTDPTTTDPTTGGFTVDPNLVPLTFPDHPWTYDEIHPVRANGTVGGQEASDLLDEIEADYLQHSITSYVDYDILFDNPENFGLDSMEPTWGEVMSDDINADFEEELSYQEGVLDQLLTIDRDSLDEDDLLFYDKILYDVEEDIYSLSFTGPGFLTPVFNPLTGQQCDLLFILDVMDFDTEEEASNYITLLADIERYYGELCDYEELRCQYGYGCSDDTYEEIAVSFDNLAIQKDDCFLYESFENRLDNISDLSDESRADLIASHEDVMKNTVFPTFENCAQRMRDLKGYCRNDMGLYWFDGGIATYEEIFRGKSNSSMTPAEAAAALDDAISQIYDSEMAIATNATPDSAWVQEYMNHDYSVGGVQENLDYLYGVIFTDFPDIPDHNYFLREVPEVFADNFSPAAYLGYHLDNYDSNMILINTAAAQTDFGTVVAHEAYPGHMFQSVYTRGATNHPYMYIADSVGYVEGWAQYVECQSPLLFGADPTAASLFSMDTSLNVLLMARVDIGINYEGWSLDEAVDYVNSEFGLAATTDSFSDLYNICVQIPGYAIPYAMGYYNTVSIMQTLQTEYPDLSMKDIHTAYLNALTGPYEQILEACRRQLG